MPPVGALVRDRLAPLFSMNRVVIYALCSILAITATTLNAMRTYNNFYSVAIHLSRSNRSLLVRGLCLTL
jgi:E3 ubiquitin-protein ligase synoviolin